MTDAARQAAERFYDFDPARAIASMLSKLSDEDQYTFNSLIAQAVRAERERCAGLAENPYGDNVEAFGSDEPSVVGEKIAAAIRLGPHRRPR